MRRLIFGCDLKQLFLCGALKMDPRSFPLHPATLFMLPVYCLQRDRDLLLPWREKENQSDLAINHCGEEYCFTKECRHVSVSFHFYFAKTLTEAGGVFFRWYSFSKMILWQLGCRSDTADLTLSRKSFLSLVLVVMWRFWPVISSWRLPPAHHSCHPENTRGTEEGRGKERRGWKKWGGCFSYSLSEVRRTERATVLEATETQPFVLCLSHMQTHTHTHAHTHTQTWPPLPHFLTAEFVQVLSMSAVDGCGGGGVWGLVWTSARRQRKKEEGVEKKGAIGRQSRSYFIISRHVPSKWLKILFFNVYVTKMC